MTGAKMQDYEDHQNYEDLQEETGTTSGQSQINDLFSFAEKLKAQDESLVGESNLLWLSPDVLEEEDGFNLRDYDRNDTVSHIQSLKEAWKKGTQLPPLEVKIENGHCYVRDGHCRLRAARLAIAEGALIKRIPVIELNGSVEASYIRVLTSNEQLKLTLLQRAHGYKRLRDTGMSDIKIAKEIGKTDTHVRETIRLLSLPFRLQELLTQDVISSDMASKMFARYGDKAVEYIEEAYEKQKKQQEEMLESEPSTDTSKAPKIKVSAKHISVPAPRITKKMITNMSSNVRTMHDAFEGSAKVDTQAGVVDLKLPLELYEQFMAMAKNLKEVSEVSSDGQTEPVDTADAQGQQGMVKAEVIELATARKAG